MNISGIRTQVESIFNAGADAESTLRSYSHVLKNALFQQDMMFSGMNRSILPSIDSGQKSSIYSMASQLGELQLRGSLQKIELAQQQDLKKTKPDNLELIRSSFDRVQRDMIRPGAATLQLIA